MLLHQCGKDTNKFNSHEWKFDEGLDYTENQLHNRVLWDQKLVPWIGHPLNMGSRVSFAQKFPKFVMIMDAHALKDNLNVICPFINIILQGRMCTLVPILMQISHVHMVYVLNELLL